MASLRQEQRYGLSCGKSSRSGPSSSSSGGSSSGCSRTLYHVKLTDTALRALEAYQNLKGSLPNEPSVCFKGNQGYIKIPAPTPESLSALRIFSFYLSSDSKDQPQASFDCIHQYVSSDGREKLEGQGIIQDKITVCATEDSYQVTRERMSQVEKDSWSRSAIEIKPGATHPSKCVKFHKWSAPPPPTPPPPPPPPPASDKQSSNNRRSGGSATPTLKPLRERIIHLLALKPYRKPELLLWLERVRVSPKDKAELGTILDEVAKVNPKDSSYVLRDDFYRYVQRDWPGYSEEERQLISRLQARKQISNQSRSLQANLSILKSTEDTTPHLNTLKNPAVKRPVPFDSLERLAVKRQKLVEQRLQQQPAVNGLSNGKSHDNATPTLNHSFHTKTEFHRTANHAGNQNASPGDNSDFPVVHKLSRTSDTPVSESRDQEPNFQPPQDDTACTQQPFSNSHHKKKKPKKHKDKERERLKDNKRSDWLEKSPDLKQTQDKLDDAEITNTVASEEKPDYVLTYGPIASVEQRKRYQEDFCAEYDEYKDLHSRIATITHMFVQLGSKIKCLSPGTQDHKIMEEQILEKYKKYRKKFPGYREEKKRCEYLHEKLSYIKQLIIDYDISQTSS